MDLEKIWNDTLNILKISISQANFSTWLSQTKIVSVKTVNEERQIVEIGCSSSFIADTIEKRYFGPIQDALNQTTGLKNDLSFVVSQIQPKEQKERSIPLFTQESNSTEREDLSYLLKKSRVRQGFTFENFAVSSSNQMAWAAAEAVANNLGKAYNPLFLWGGVGVGKTHLMLAIGYKILKKDTNLKIHYCMGEEFTTEIVEAIRNKSTQGFKKKYRNLDLLMLDDVQFIAGKNAVQEEFFHTFNTLLREGGQVVLTSDKPPSEIEKLEERLRSRFEAGLIIDISPPDFELRSAIALIKAQEKGIQLPMDVAQTIATHIDSLRRIEGFLIRLFSETGNDPSKINIETVNRLLGTTIKSDYADSLQKRAVLPQDVVEAVSTYFSLGRRKLLGDGRSRPIAGPRQMLMYLLRVELGLPLTEVGHIVGGRDHTTVMHAVEKISKNLSTDESLRNDIMGIKRTTSG